MPGEWQGFQVDMIADDDHDLLTRYADLVQCETLDPAGFHYYAITILRGHFNPEYCDLLPPPMRNSPGTLSRHIFRPVERPDPGLLRICGILDNGAHIHQYEEPGGAFTLRVVPVSQ